MTTGMTLPIAPRRLTGALTSAVAGAMSDATAHAAHPVHALVEAVRTVAALLADIGASLLSTALAAPGAAAAVAAAAAGMAFGLRFALRRAQHRRWLVGARLVTVLAPPRVHPEGAAALWGHLAGLARPAWRRLAFGQPHLCFEYLITSEGSTIRIWVPGPVPPGLVESAVAAAWPGATTRTSPATLASLRRRGSRRRGSPRRRRGRPRVARGHRRWGPAPGPPWRTTDRRGHPRGSGHRAAGRARRSHRTPACGHDRRLPTAG